MTKWLRRSEYDHAVNAGRRARRAGDLASAERWLKHADRHLAHSERHDAVIHRMQMRDEELHRVRAETVRQSAPSQESASLQQSLYNRLEALLASDEAEDTDF